MVGKYIGNRPVKVRKSTWKERSADGKDTEWISSSVAVNDKSLAKGFKNNQKYHPKKKKGAARRPPRPPRPRARLPRAPRPRAPLVSSRAQPRATRND